MAATVLANVRVFDGSAVAAPATITISGGRITGDPAPAGAERVDGAGGVLLPGFIDSHLHLDRREDLADCARAGVTTVLDMGSRQLGTVDALRGLPGLPAVLRAGPPASAPGGVHTKKLGFPAATAIADDQQASRFVAERAAEGVDYIKVIVEDPRMPGTAALPGPVIAAIVTAAHRAGLRVIAHAVTVAAFRLAADAGADVITHAPVDRDLSAADAAALAARGAVLVPTLTMMKGTTAAIARKPVFRVLRSLRIAPAVDFGHARRCVTVAHANGVTILAGTDANNEPGAPWHPAHGSSLHDELSLLVAAGLTPAEAIRAATVTPASCFALHDRGVIEPGKRGDLVLVDGDPTADIAATRAIRGVWIGGNKVG
ncbi:MAG: amidohydrolase family protein [Actinomycetota bacterium]